MMPDGDTTAHLRKQVGGLFFYLKSAVAFVEKNASPPPLQDRERVAALHESGIGPNSDLELG